MAIISNHLALNLPEGSDIFNHDTFLRQNFQKIDDMLKPAAVEEFTATEGQTVFTTGHTYVLGNSEVSVEIDGVPQSLGSGFTETTTNSVTLSEGVQAGTKVKVIFHGTLPAQDNRLDTLTTQFSGIYNSKQYNVVGNGIVGDSDSIQAMINTVRSNVIANGLTSFYTIEIPSGTYIIDKEIKMSPYIKLKSNGIVIFKITHNGTAFWVAPTTGDPTYSTTTAYHLNKNIWNRGEYFDGSNGAFVFVSTLDKDTTGNNVVAVELGDRSSTSNAGTPISRYTITNVNVFNLDTAFKWNSVNHYIGTYKHCHIEGNNHAVKAVSLTTGAPINSGENFVFDNCVIAAHKKEAILISVAGHDITFQNTSFDFNASPVFRSQYAGVCLRLLNCYLEKIGNGTTEEQLIYVTDNLSAGTFFSRNSFYAKNFVLYLQRPTQLFKNNPNGEGSRISQFIDLEMELRFQDTEVNDPYNLANRFMIPSGENFFILKHKILHTANIRNLVSKDLNLLSNGDFSKSTLAVDLSVGGSDPYWFCSFKSNISNPTIVAEGVGGSNCVKYTPSNTTNSIKLENKFMYDVEPGEQLFLSSIFRSDKISSRNEFQYRFEFYDANNVLLSTFNYYDFPTSNATLTTVDGTQFRQSRSVANVFVPSGASKVKPYVIAGNLEGTNIWIDDIHFSKSK